MRAELGGPRAGSAPRSGAWAGGDERPLVAERGTPLPCKGTPPLFSASTTPFGKLPEKTPLWRILGRGALFASFFQ